MMKRFDVIVSNQNYHDININIQDYFQTDSKDCTLCIVDVGERGTEEAY